MLRGFGEYLRSELRLIRSAPVAFTVSLIVVGIVVLLAARRHFAGQIGRLQAEIKARTQPPAPVARTLRGPPRRLSTREKQFLVKVLSNAQSRAIVYLIPAPRDAEALSYAADLNEAISHARWQTHIGPPELAPRVSPEFWHALPGLVLFVNDRSKTPGAELLAEAITVAGLPVRWGADQRLPANTCELLVGTRPGPFGS